MKLYEIEVGATYWVAAKNIKDAINALWACPDVGDLCEVLECDFLHIDEVSPKRAETLRFREDDEENPNWLMVDLAKKCEQPEVIACSEWP